MTRRSGFDRLVVAAVAAGVLAVAAGVVLERPVATHLGATPWWLVFSGVVGENFISRRPVRTRGGLVRQEDGRLRYALPYLGLAVMIVLGGVMVSFAWVMA